MILDFLPKVQIERLDKGIHEAFTNHATILYQENKMWQPCVAFAYEIPQNVRRLAFNDNMTEISLTYGNELHPEVGICRNIFAILSEDERVKAETIRIHMSHIILTDKRPRNDWVYGRHGIFLVSAGFSPDAEKKEHWARSDAHQAVDEVGCKILRTGLASYGRPKPFWFNANYRFQGMAPLPYPRIKNPNLEELLQKLEEEQKIVAQNF